MKNLIRAVFATVALSTLFNVVPAKAEGTCILGIVCVGDGGGGASNAPEISGSMLSTGLRNRRRVSK
jgi:hypothetical protein